ncbi:alkaline phosphatase PhoX [Raineyella sp. LH-20]|uniref:alkaline phosphatase PhoX n=1 Tax=Raineyella sp. LH-20 TaxID=3081204 RepID=UPI002952F143|nr:alkaline phosphatase PhoX [Raineyella sp. LH-20]WOP17706.1 DUF839 domain-containing protein [Raineyella sp. LH-20]
MALTRRSVLKGSAISAGLVAFSGIAQAPAAMAAPGKIASGTGTVNAFGDLITDPNGLLDLPRGFSYKVVSKVGDIMPGDGRRLPDRFDGAAVFAGADKSLVMVRNHEQYDAPTTAGIAAQDSADPEFVYDAGARLVNGTSIYAANGGTSTVTLDKQGATVDEYVSLAGTYSNCAGGATPWHTWLSCEETESPKIGQNGATKAHGYVFEVDPFDKDNNKNPFPLKALGRFPHEAAVVDPRTLEVYLTEDASGPFGLFYKAILVSPKAQYGGLRGDGDLYAMNCFLNGTQQPTLHPFSKVGTVLDVEWVKIPDPDATTTSTRKQLANDQVTRSQKIEGAWFGNGKAHFVVSFADGFHEGQVWAYDPMTSTLELEVYYPTVVAGGGAEDSVPDRPDGITGSPFGGLIISEDSNGGQNVLAVAEDGSTSLLARNRRDIIKPTAEGISEITGVTFSPDGKTLFFAFQEPGITFAVSGPFAQIKHYK